MTHADLTLEADTQAFRDLMLRLSRIHRQRVVALLAISELTGPQYGVLLQLSRREQAATAADVRGLTMSDLAEQTQQVAATMTGIVDRLVERDLVVRQQDPADRRAWRVVLTDAGRRLLGEVEARQQTHTVGLMARFSASERAQLLQLMGSYLDAMVTEDMGVVESEVETLT